jgi:nucleotide-binding universal stress UspA family protein
MPRKGQTELVLDHVTIAWKPTRACARAVQDAMPLLQRARAVTLSTVDSPMDQTPPDTAVGEYLSAHGISISLERHNSRGFERIGDAILAAAQETQANILVMGAHGQSRLKELIFGGATREVLQRMRLPVLMSH